MSEPLLKAAVATAKAVDTNGLANKFFGPAFEEIGNMLAEEVRIRLRLPRNIKLLQRFKQILEDEKIESKSVDLKVLLPLLNASVLEDDDEMSERWASLLASAADPNNKSKLEASFVEVLKQLAPCHAFLLDVFYECVERRGISKEKWNEEGVILSELRAFLKKEIPDFDVAIQNLLRLRLVALPTARLGIANGQEVRVTVTSSDILCGISFGHAFVSACKRGRRPGNTSYGVPTDSISNRYCTRGQTVKIWGKDDEISWEKKNGKLSGYEPL